MRLQFPILALILWLPGWAAFAGAPVVVDAVAARTGDSWRFDVTIRHDDTGGENYADGWGVYTPDGRELGYRVLVHPHVDEQPFTRSLGGVALPDGLTSVVIRPHDLRYGWGAEYRLDLKR